MEFRKMLMITLYAEQKKKKEDTDLQYSLLDSVGEGEGEMYGKSNVETHIAICKIYSQKHKDHYSILTYIYIWNLERC